MKKVLLALGEENFSALIRKEFEEYAQADVPFDVLMDEVLSRNFLEPLTMMYSPDYLVIHDLFLSTTAHTPKERDEEMLRILHKIRMQSSTRIVYICQRQNSDNFLSQLVALGIYDIFNEQVINAVSFKQQLLEPPKFSNVMKWTESLGDVPNLDVQLSAPKNDAVPTEDVAPAEKQKRSLLSQLKKLSPFKVPAVTERTHDEKQTISGDSERSVPEYAEPVIEAAPVPGAFIDTSVDVTESAENELHEEHAKELVPFDSKTRESENVVVPIVDETPIETAPEVKPPSSEATPLKEVSGVDVFAEVVQSSVPVKRSIVDVPTPVDMRNPNEEVPGEHSPSEHNTHTGEVVTVQPILPENLKEDFLLTKQAPVDTLEAFTERMPSESVTVTAATQPLPPTSSPMQPLGTEMDTSVEQPSEPTAAPTIEDHIAPLANMSQWQHFLQSHEPYQPRGQYATVYAIGHLARDLSTTQFAINCAVLLRERYEKVAFVELNQNLNLEYVQAYATGAQPFMNEDYYFETYGITHFKYKVGLPLQDILQRFDAVVLDLGMINNLHPYKTYFERGNYRLLLTPTYQWSWHLVDTFIHYDQHALNDYQFVMLNASKHDVNNFKRIYGSRILLHALNSSSRMYEMAEDEKQALRPLIGLKKGSRLKNMIIQ